MRFGKKSKTGATAQLFPAAVFFCLLLVPLGGFAKTLAEYRESVKKAAEYTRGLSVYFEESAGSAGGERGSSNALPEREAVARIRATLPATEKVEWDGSVVETGNQWLEAKLKAFEDEKAAAARRAIVTEIDERLAAIGQKIDELENAVEANRTKDENKRKLAEILDRVEYRKPEEQQESWFARVQKSIKKWFDNKFPQPDVPPNAGAGLQTVSLGLQILLYAVVLGFIAFLIYRFAPFFAGRFRRRAREEDGERIILGEKLAAHEDAQTLFDEAEALARGGNLRAAIRKGYIALLCELSDRKLIGLAQHKTNRDYLRDVRKERTLYENMHGLTGSFERHWYGFEQADEADWQEFKRIYQQAVRDVN